MNLANCLLATLGLLSNPIAMETDIFSATETLGNGVSVRTVCEAVKIAFTEGTGCRVCRCATFL